MGIEFGSFNAICGMAALVICPLVGTDEGIEPRCYSRNVDVAGTLIFQPCGSFIDGVVMIASTLSLRFSDVLRAHCSDYNDSHYDLPYPMQVYRCRWVVVTDQNSSFQQSSQVARKL
jgi:hypothetical protein